MTAVVDTREAADRRLIPTIILVALVAAGCFGDPLPSRSLELETSVYPGQDNNPFEFYVAAVSTEGPIHYTAVLEPSPFELEIEGISASLWWERDGEVRPGWPEVVKVERDAVERFTLGLDLAIDGGEPIDTKLIVSVYVDDEVVGDELGPDEDLLVIDLSGGPK